MRLTHDYSSDVAFASKARQSIRFSAEKKSVSPPDEEREALTPIDIESLKDPGYVGALLQKFFSGGLSLGGVAIGNKPKAEKVRSVKETPPPQKNYGQALRKSIFSLPKAEQLHAKMLAYQAILKQSDTSASQKEYLVRYLILQQDIGFFAGLLFPKEREAKNYLKRGLLKLSASAPKLSSDIQAIGRSSPHPQVNIEKLQATRTLLLGLPAISSNATEPGAYHKALERWQEKLQEFDSLTAQILEKYFVQRDPVDKISKAHQLSPDEIQQLIDLGAYQLAQDPHFIALLLGDQIKQRKSTNAKISPKVVLESRKFKLSPEFLEEARQQIERMSKSLATDFVKYSSFGDLDPLKKHPGYRGPKKPSNVNLSAEVSEDKQRVLEKMAHTIKYMQKIIILQTLEALTIEKFISPEKASSQEQLLIQSIQKMEDSDPLKKLAISLFIYKEEWPEVSQVSESIETVIYKTKIPELIEHLWNNPTLRASLVLKSEELNEPISTVRKNLFSFNFEGPTENEQALSGVFQGCFEKLDIIHPHLSTSLKQHLMNRKNISQLAEESKAAFTTIKRRINFALMLLLYDPSFMDAYKQVKKPFLSFSKKGVKPHKETNEYLLMQLLELYRNAKEARISPAFIGDLNSAIDSLKEVHIEQRTAYLNVHELMNAYIYDKLSKKEIFQLHKLKSLERVERLFNNAIQILVESKELKPYFENHLLLLRSMKETPITAQKEFFKHLLSCYLDEGVAEPFQEENKRLKAVLLKAFEQVKRENPVGVEALFRQLVQEQKLRDIQKALGINEYTFKIERDKALKALWNDPAFQKLLDESL